jgi:hypothetical protein
VIAEDAGALTLKLSEASSPPGAPDVRVYLSPDPDGGIDASAIDLGPAPDGEPALTRRIPDGTEIARVRTVVIQCRVFSLRFGHGSLVPVRRP